MERCWKFSPDDRPMFKSIVEHLNDLLLLGCNKVKSVRRTSIFDREYCLEIGTREIDLFSAQSLHLNGKQRT